jgi:hypothetical protein
LGLLYRCAELTRANGYDYFAIQEGGLSSTTTDVQTAGHYQGTTQAYGNTTYTSGTYTPGMTIPVTRHRGSVVIKLYKEGDRPSDPRMYKAESLIKIIGPQIGASKEGS